MNDVTASGASTTRHLIRCGVLGASLFASAWAQTPPLHRTQFLATGPQPVSIAAADLDADAHPDFVVLDAEAMSAAVFRGLGAARFQNVATVPLPATPRKALLADVNGDLDADLVWTGVGPGGAKGVIAVDYGAIGATFAGRTTVKLSLIPESIALADLDADGDLDVVVSGDGTFGGSQVALQNNGGSFGAEIPVDAGSCADLACGDLDNDGLPEIVAAIGSSTRVYSNSGQFSFTASHSYPEVAEAKHLVIADLSGDGHLDVATAVLAPGFPSSSRVVVRHGRGDGTLDDSAQTFLSFADPVELIAADVDADGDVDLEHFRAVGVTEDWISEGNGKRRIELNSMYSSSRGQVALDVDGDADLDVLSIDVSRPGVLLHRRDASDGLGATASFDSPGFWRDAVLCDTDQDGRLDVVARNANGVVVHRVLPGAGLEDVAGSVAGDQVLSATETYPLAVLDLNHDGDLDIAAVDGNNVQVAFGAPGATFGPLGAPQYIGGGQSPSIALGDLDHDGDSDLLVAKTIGQGGFLYVNRNQAGAFLNTASYFVGRPARDVAVADFNGDSHLDAALATDNGTAGEILVYFGDGALALTPGPTFPVARATFVDTVDWNGDGKLDIVGGATPTVWLSNGSGGFTALPTLPAPSDPSARLRAVRDIDGDGSLDLVFDALFNPALQRYQALLMQRRLTSGMVEEIVPYAYNTAVYLADLDGDGRSEIFQSAASPFAGYPGNVAMQRPFPGPASCGGALERYGTACPATAGGVLPTLAAYGCATAFGTLALELDYLVGGGTALIFFGSGSAAAPIGHGCVLAISGIVPSPVVHAFAGPNDYGIAAFESVLPAVLAGHDLRAQAFVVPQNGISFAASNGVRILVN